MFNVPVSNNPAWLLSRQLLSAATHHFLLVLLWESLSADFTSSLDTAHSSQALAATREASEHKEQELSSWC